MNQLHRPAIVIDAMPPYCSRETAMSFWRSWVEALVVQRLGCRLVGRA